MIGRYFAAVALGIGLVLTAACSDRPSDSTATPAATASEPSPEQLRDDCEGHDGHVVLIMCQGARQMYDLIPRNLEIYASFRDQLGLAQQRHAEAQNEVMRRNALSGDPIYPQSCRVLCERLIRAGMENAARATRAAGKSDWLK